MREIKFRAWNKHAHKMAVIDALMFSLGSYLAHTDDGFSGSGNLSDIILMQFTGILDKNGKEIYEGDLLIHRYPAGETIYQAKIGESSHQADGLEFTYYGAYLDEVSSTTPYSHGIASGYGYPALDEMEIIGNCYETPELVVQEVTA